MQQTISPSRKQNLRFACYAAATLLITKFLILFFGFQAYQVLADKPIESFWSYLDLWVRWDAKSYLYIAENGYPAGGEYGYVIVYFPLYPLLVAIFGAILQNYVLSAFVVSGIASTSAAILFRRLVREDYSEKIAQSAVLFLCIFPTAYFLHIPYTESLFLMTVIGCFLAARREFWLTAGIMGFCACLTRINGIILFPALLFEVRNEYLRTRKINRRICGLLLIPAGFIGYLLLNRAATGNALMFLDYQRRKWSKFLDLPFAGLWGKYKTVIDQSPANSVMVGFQELFFVAIGLAAIVLGWRYLRNSYRVWMIGNWLLFVCTSFILSVPRYTLTMFPLFILAALAARKNSFLNILFIVWSILFLALFSTVFIKGGWAF